MLQYSLLFVVLVGISIGVVGRVVGKVALGGLGCAHRIRICHRKSHQLEYVIIEYVVEYVIIESEYVIEYVIRICRRKSPNVVRKSHRFAARIKSKQAGVEPAEEVLGPPAKTPLRDCLPKHRDDGKTQMSRGGSKGHLRVTRTSRGILSPSQPQPSDVFFGAAVFNRPSLSASASMPRKRSKRKHTHTHTPHPIHITRLCARFLSRWHLGRGQRAWLGHPRRKPAHLALQAA